MSIDSQHFFDLVRPCGACPFRSDKDFFLPVERKEQIAESLRVGEAFTCHKTLEYTDEGPHHIDRSRACAGAAGTLANEGLPEQQNRQVASRLGFPVPPLADDLPLYGSLQEWIDA